MKKGTFAPINKSFIQYLISNIKRDFYNIETVKRGQHYILTIYPLALNRCLTELKSRTYTELISSENCVYKYSIKPLQK